MHTYRQQRQYGGSILYTVGFLDDGGWWALKDFTGEENAAAYVSYLNGGDHPRKPFPPEG